MEFQPGAEDLQNLREWIKKTPHVPNDYDDEFLSAFVRSCKGSLQKTKTALENFNGLGLKCPEMFGNFDLSEEKIRGTLSEGRFMPLPKLTADGSMVFIGATESGFNPNVSQIMPSAFFKLWLMTIYIIYGYGPGKWILLIDCKTSSLSNLADFKPTALKQVLQAMEKAMPVRLQALNLCNVPQFFEWVMPLVKSIAKKKMTDRIFFHSSLESLFNSFPKELLPEDYGGNEASVKILYIEWRKKLASYQARLLEEQKKMRELDPIRPKPENDVEEMVGTFKKLDFD